MRDTTINAQRLNGLLTAIANTEDDEIDCDALGEIIAKVVEAAAAGEDVRATLPQISLHLDHCPDCRDWYETLVALTRDSA